MYTDPLYSADTLLRLVAEGDEKAFAALFHAHWDHIYRVAYTVTRSSSLSEDLVQEIFLKIWINRGKLVSVADFDNYLFIVARNHIYTAFRKQGRKDDFLKELMELSTAVSLSPEQELVKKEARQIVSDAVRQLSSQQQAVYRLSREEGLKYEEIAVRLGISKSTVRNHMVRALEVIREYLRTHADGWVLVLGLLSATL